MPYYMHELNPDYNPATGALQHMTTEELKSLLNNGDEKIESMIRDLQQVKNLEAERELYLANNKSLAESNVSQEPILEELKVRLKEQADELKAYKNRLEIKKKALDELSETMSLDTTLALLQTAAAQSEEVSESISDSFLSGEISVEAFVESYLNTRKLTHLRRVKVEKMVELLNSHASRNINLPNTPPYPTGGIYPFPGIPFQG